MPYTRQRSSDAKNPTYLISYHVYLQYQATLRTQHHCADDREKQRPVLAMLQFQYLHIASYLPTSQNDLYTTPYADHCH